MNFRLTPIYGRWTFFYLARWRAICLLISLFLPFASIRSRAAESQVPSPITREQASQALERLRQFVELHMTGPRSEIFANAVTNRPSILAEARNHECLSETVGQRMELALLENDREAFEAQFTLVKEVFAGVSGLLSWKVSPDFKTRADTSASLDDWRVAEACKIAVEKWKLPAVYDFGLQVATVLTKASTKYNLPPHALDIATSQASSGKIPLCYLHFAAMQTWKMVVPTLPQILKQSQAILLSSSSIHGLIPETYDPDSNSYSIGKSDEVLALIALLHLQAVDPKNKIISEGILRRSLLLKLPVSLPQAYDLVSGNSEQTPAGASVYALLSRLLLRAGQKEAAALSLARMLEFQNPKGHRFDGAIGDEPVYSFDQLESMLALREFLN